MKNTQSLRSPQRALFKTLSVVALLVLGSGAKAELGNAPLQPDLQQKQQANAVKKLLFTSNAAALYSVSVVEFQSGVQLTEYMDQTGRVFALKWSGPIAPDMSVLLGTYFSVYKDELDKSRALHLGGKRNVAVSANDLVTASSGHLRDWRGYAYAPSLVPAGVDVYALIR